MKKILGAVVAGSMALSSVSALEVYKDGENFVNITGSVRGYLGYGYADKRLARTPAREHQSDILFGVQGNTRVGLDFNYNGFFGGFLIGAKEKTLLSSSTSDVPGFRQAYAGYDFGSAGKLLVGKKETLTTMDNNFSSDIIDTDSGSNGFGGYSTSTRRFQIQYILPMGLSFALSENDMRTGDSDKHYLSGKKNENVPSVAVSYDLKNENLVAKVAARYAYSANSYKDAVVVMAGVKPSFGNAWVSALVSYGMNGHIIGEQQTKLLGVSKGGFETGNLTDSEDLTNGIARDVNRYAGYAEFGYKLNDSLKAIIGGGYQFTYAGNTAKYHSYTGFVQLPYSINKYFTIIPQVGYNGVAQAGSTVKDGVFAFAQFRANL